MNAANQPVRRAQRELHPDDVKIAQKPPIVDREDMLEEIVLAPEVLQKNYADALAFAEEPVTVRLERSAEKFAPKFVDVTCNGKGAEVLVNRRWVETKVLPVGMPVTTKRKYVEILLKSKIDTINTDSGKIDEDSEKNLIERSTSQKSPLSIIRDDNPKGVAWYQGLVHFG